MSVVFGGRNISSLELAALKRHPFAMFIFEVSYLIMVFVQKEKKKKFLLGWRLQQTVSDVHFPTLTTSVLRGR
jgi:hypothetical protein